MVLLDQVGRVSRRRKERRRLFREVEKVADADREVRGVDERAAPRLKRLGNPREVSTQISTTSSAWNQTSGMTLCSICTW